MNFESTTPLTSSFGHRLFFFLAVLAFAFARLWGFVIFKRLIQVLTSLSPRFPVTKFFESFQLRAILLQCGNRKFSFLFCTFWDGDVRTGILDVSGFAGVTGSFLILSGVTGSFLICGKMAWVLTFIYLASSFNNLSCKPSMTIPLSSLGGGWSPPVMEVGICLSLSARSCSFIVNSLTTGSFKAAEVVSSSTNKDTSFLHSSCSSSSLAFWCAFSWTHLFLSVTSTRRMACDCRTSVVFIGSGDGIGLGDTGNTSTRCGVFLIV